MVPILIISADEDLRYRLRDFFPDSRFEILVADNPHTAVGLYGLLKDPVVVLEADSSEFDGLSALQTLKRLATRPKVVAVCRSPSDRRARLLTAAGANAVVDSATDSEALLEPVEMILRKM